MPQTDALDMAILLGEQQLQSLREGNVDRFVEGIDGFARACDDVAGLATASAPPDVRERLNRLLGSIDAAQLELGSLLREAASRMKWLRRQERAADGYLGAPTWSPVHSDRA